MGLRGFREWIALVFMIIFMNGCAKNQVVQSDTTTVASSPLQGADVELLPIRDGVWIHRSYAEIAPLGRVSANGLLVVGKEEALLIDTPWNDAQVSWVFAETQKRFQVPITNVVVTHAHDDNLGGLAMAHQLGAHSYALQLTIEKARDEEKPVPQNGFTKEHTLMAAGQTAELYYPGPGHAEDNIAVFLPHTGIVFGGCLIKAAGADSMGNTAEADIEHWASSVGALEERFPDASVVVPGHGDAGDRGLYEHTQHLIILYRNETMGNYDYRRLYSPNKSVQHRRTR